MLMAYDDGGFKIKDMPTEETRVPLNSINDLSKAKQILAWAKTERPDVTWAIGGNDPYRVYAKL